jgi:hypothetical protein
MTDDLDPEPLDEDCEPEDLEALDDTKPAGEPKPLKVYVGKERIIRSLEANYPKLWESAQADGVLAKISSAANPAGCLEVYAVGKCGVPLGQRRTMVKSVKKILIVRNMTLLDAAKKNILDSLLQVAMVRALKRAKSNTTQVNFEPVAQEAPIVEEIAQQSDMTA